MTNLDDLIGGVQPKALSMERFPKEVGRRLRLQRIAFKWRQADLALRAGVSVQTIRTAERGEAISSSNFLRILLAMNQGSDLLDMLDAPNFPSLKAHERYVRLTRTADSGLVGRRVRTGTLATRESPAAI